MNASNYAVIKCTIWSLLKLSIGDCSHDRWHFGGFCPSAGRDGCQEKTYLVTEFIIRSANKRPATSGSCEYTFIFSCPSRPNRVTRKTDKSGNNYTWLCANIHRQMSRSWWSIVQSEYGDAICTAWSVSIGWFTLMRRGAHLQLLMRSAIRRHEQKGKHGTALREKMKTNSVN